MPQIVDADALHAGAGAASGHPAPDQVLRKGEEPLLGETAGLRDVVLHLPGEGGGDVNGPAAVGSLGRGEEILSVAALIGPTDGDTVRGEIKVRRGEGQKLSHPHPGPEQQGEQDPGEGVLRHSGEKAVKLLHRPEGHISPAAPSQGAGQPAGIFRQAVIAHRIAEQGGGLAADGAQVTGGERLPEQLTLPGAQNGGRDLPHRQSPQSGEHVSLQQKFLGLCGGWPEPKPEISPVVLVESLHRHGGAGILAVQKGPLIGFGVALTEKALFLMLTDRAGPVPVADRDIPAPAVFHFGHRHGGNLLLTGMGHRKRTGGIQWL